MGLSSYKKVKERAAQKRQEMLNNHLGHLARTNGMMANLFNSSPSVSEKQSDITESQESSTSASPTAENISSADTQQPSTKSDSDPENTATLKKDLRVSKNSPREERNKKQTSADSRDASSSPVSRRDTKKEASSQSSSEPLWDCDALSLLKTTKNLSVIGMALLLRDLVGPFGGAITLRELSRNSGLSLTSINNALKNLRDFGIIAVTNSGRAGISFRWNVPLQYPARTSEKDLPTSHSGYDSSYLPFRAPLLPFMTALGGKPLVRRFLACYFALLCYLKKEPLDYTPQVLASFVTAAHEKGAEWAVALFLEHLPKAQTNPSAYIATILSRGVTPVQKSMMISRQVCDASEKILLDVGKKILPDDWHACAALLKMPVNTGSVSIENIQNNYRERRDIFCNSIIEPPQNH